jgi:hypothetical protein
VLISQNSRSWAPTRTRRPAASTAVPGNIKPEEQDLKAEKASKKQTQQGVDKKSNNSARGQSKARTY